MEILLDKVKKYLGTSLILENVSFIISDVEKVGIYRDLSARGRSS